LVTVDFAPEIVRAAAAGERTSQEILLETAWPHAFRIAKSILRNDTLAEDAAQEACAKTLSSIGTVRDPNSFRAWFFRLVVRQSLSELKKPQIFADVQSRSGDPTDSYVTSLDVRAALFALPITPANPNGSSPLLRS
jgi:DNA-directed RNA polymerase specialized sigma24 family protein